LRASRSSTERAFVRFFVGELDEVAKTLRGAGRVAVVALTTALSALVATFTRGRVRPPRA
jgi:hypothetical protein